MKIELLITNELGYTLRVFNGARYKDLMISAEQYYELQDFLNH